MFWLRNKKISFSLCTLNYKVLHVQDINSKHPDEMLQKLNPGISSGSALLAKTNHPSEKVGNYKLRPLSQGLFSGEILRDFLNLFKMGLMGENLIAKCN